MRKTFAALLGMAAIAVAPAHAQGVTVEQVAQGYVEAVTLCAQAQVGGGGIAQLPEAERAKVAEGGPQTRAFVNAQEGQPVWDVLSANGIVVIKEPSAAECEVTAYGPRVRPVFDAAAQALTSEALGFQETQTRQDPSSILRSFVREADGRRVSVTLDGGEPGMPGRTFRFPMLLAFIRSN